MKSQVTPTQLGKGAAMFFFFWSAVMLVLSAVAWANENLAGAIFGVLFALILVGLGAYGWRNRSPIQAAYHEYDESGQLSARYIDEHLGEVPPNKSIEPGGRFSGDRSNPPG